MRMSKFYMPTLRDTPSEAEISSHSLLLRAGMVRQLVSGVYTYLPLGYNVIKKIEKIVREEMDAAGSQELLMSAIQPRELWEATDRWANFGPEMIKVFDRHEREFCLGPTHEEVITATVKGEVNSYRQLPLNLYQIQTKYRDEKRPRFGVIRAREFIMKDAYSFDRDPEGMKNSYKEMWEAYDKIFTRLRLRYKIVEGDSGAMGGNESHEFMAMSEVGEGLVAYCDECNYAATDEKARVVYEVAESQEEMKELEKVHTPNATTIADLEEFFKVEKNKFGKALVYVVGDKPVLALIPGDRELNETKLCNALGIAGHELEIADDATIEYISGADKGFTGPIGLKGDVRILVDASISKMKNLIVGGNETDYHIKNANFARDFQGEIVEDLLQIEENDKCPECGSQIKMDRGIEVGNIFQLGTKYSEGLNLKYIDQDGKEKYIYMGSYGVGVSRTLAAIVEQYHDEHGIIWPLVVAPYQVMVTIINTKREEQKALGEKIYKELKEEGLEVLLDDRNESAGVKFNDRDLIGIPIRITVGKKAGENLVEYSLRQEKDRIEIPVEDLGEKIRQEFERQGLKI